MFLLIRTVDRLEFTCHATLNSIMFLLIPETQQKFLIVGFKFHYVSINSSFFHYIHDDN